MIRLELPGLPLSSNHAYFNMRGRGRALTTEGRAYLTGTTAYLQQRFRQEMMFFRKNVPYCILTFLYFEKIENDGYPKHAKNRYKTLDGSNRIKLLEDALKTAGGIDDSQTLCLFWQKKQGSPERTRLFVWDLEAETTPFDDALRNL